MPWSNDKGPKSSGPWGGGGGRGSGGDGGGPWGGRGSGSGGGGGGQGPNIDDFFKKGQSQLKTVLGDGGGGGVGFLLILVVAAVAWLWASFYTVKPEEEAVVLTFGKYTNTQGPGLNFAPWPVQTAEIRAVTRENVIDIGASRSGAGGASTARNRGVMLTGDANIIDINFQVRWVISDLRDHLFNLQDPETTIRAVSESAMREVVGRSRLAPLLNRDRALLETEVKALIQRTMDEYNAGVRIQRVTLDRADPPPEVIDAFRDVQAAEQERDTLQKQAQAEYNKITAQARGESAQILQDAEAYRAQVVAGAEGEAARFTAVLKEYVAAKDVTRKRLYLETMERVFGDMNKIIIDEKAAGSQGVVPYLPLDQLRGGQSARADR